MNSKLLLQSASTLAAIFGMMLSANSAKPETVLLPQNDGSIITRPSSPVGIYAGGLIAIAGAGVGVASAFGLTDSFGKKEERQQQALIPQSQPQPVYQPQPAQETAGFQPMSFSRSIQLFEDDESESEDDGVDLSMVEDEPEEAEVDEPEDVWAEPVIHQPRQEQAIKQSKPQTERIDPLVHELLDQGCVWMIGRKGSGKTSKAEWFVEEYINQGCEVWIIDPHAKAGQWENLKVFGKGMNYRDVENGLKAYVEEITRRYQVRAVDESYDPLESEKRIVLVCEEMSKWGNTVAEITMRDFMGCVLADLRKANAGCLFISHGETLAMFGGTKALSGFREAINSDIAKLYTFSEPIPGSVPQKFRPLPNAEVKFPEDTQRRRVSRCNAMRATGKYFRTVDQLEKERSSRQNPQPSTSSNVVQLRRA